MILRDIRDGRDEKWMKRKHFNEDGLLTSVRIVGVAPMKIFMIVHCDGSCIKGKIERIFKTYKVAC